MTVGDFHWTETTQALGHKLRDKLHIEVCITESFRARGPYVFFFVSSSNYGSCFPISKEKYNFLDYDSYVSCSNLIFYTEAEFRMMAPIKVIGRLDEEDRSKLRNHLIGHEVMPEWQIKEAVKALS